MENGKFGMSNYKISFKQLVWVSCLSLVLNIFTLAERVYSGYLAKDRAKQLVVATNLDCKKLNKEFPRGKCNWVVQFKDF